MRATTLELLKAFHAAGGQVIFAGEPCEYVDASLSDAVIEFAAQCAITPAAGPELAKAVDQKVRRISIADAQGQEIAAALYLLREDRDAFYLFVCNTSDVNNPETNSFAQLRVVERTLAFPDVTIRGFAQCAGQPIEFDPETGKTFDADAKRAESGQWQIGTSLPALGSRLFVIPKQETGDSFPRRPQLADVRQVELDLSAWDITLSECNNLPLDRPRYRIGFGDWQAPDEILRVDRAVREAMGMRPRGGAMVQPWARERFKDPKRMPVQLIYTFDATAIPTGDLYLGLEQPQRFHITLNGAEVSTDVECGWWTDVSLRKIPLDATLIRLGANELKLACIYDEDYGGLEIVYLLGNFGTRVDGAKASVMPVPVTLHVGDWVPQGLAFYSGSVSYHYRLLTEHAEGERLFVQVPEYRGTAVRVLVNGKTAGIIAWPPNEVDITDCLDGDDVELRIEVIGHRRNSHGPLHHAQKWPMWTGPGEFITEGEDWIDAYQLVPCGLMRAPVLVTRR
jgi:hypothetical protein